ncbi:hypothetical protein MA16_Dca028291 [Dendrobium catenatum]|uniref:Uncharacterized protein n=1 Tax=Dendrobium catenatum TaxID=906689 RepID=A0A2I0VCX3_9ASPA|nr:hypothetical protein MA16_Dca028291 [Dendrobium catenatum]
MAAFQATDPPKKIRKEQQENKLLPQKSTTSVTHGETKYANLKKEPKTKKPQTKLP